MVSRMRRPINSAVKMSKHQFYKDMSNYIYPMFLTQHKLEMYNDVKMILSPVNFLDLFIFLIR